MRGTAYRAAFMSQEALAGIPQQRPDISWIFRARDSAVARLSAFRAAFMGRRGRLSLPYGRRRYFRRLSRIGDAHDD
jgi:hypothetical protein